MAIEAPISKFKKNNIKIYIVLCVIATLFFGYDGYLSKYKWSLRYSFYEKHVIDGKPDNDMKFNRKSPPFFAGAALCLYAYYRLIKNRRLLADENELIINNKQKISYDSIQKINKTHFESKGYFIITYNKDGKEVDLKINDRTYDNLEDILNLLVAKIT